MKYQHLRVEEREEVERGLWRKESLRSIAKRLGRSHSSLARGIRRNKSQGGFVSTSRRGSRTKPCTSSYTRRYATARWFAAAKICACTSADDASVASRTGHGDSSAC